MILVQEKSNVFFQGETIDTELSKDDVAHLKSILTTNLYLDNYSFLREIVSNSVDINKQCFVDKNVLIKIDLDEQGKYITISDSGCGISIDFMRNTFSQFGRSTKRNSNNEIGFFGLGRASLLAYTNKSYFITNVDGIQYTYLLTNNNGAEFNLIDQKETDEPNGTTVKVYLKKDWNEERQIIDEICNKAVYFDNVTFKEFKNPLHKSEIFWYTKDFRGDSNIHISYGGCYYPIDFSKLNRSSIKIPVALPFNIGELGLPAPNRESLRFNKENIKLINDKIDKFLEYCKEKAPLNFTDLREYVKAKKEGEFELIDGLEISYKIVDLQDKLIFEPLLPLNLSTVLPDLECFTINKTKLIKKNHKYTLTDSKQLFINDKNYLNQLYFREYMQNKTVFSIPYNKLKHWKSFLNLKEHPKSEWRKLIKLYVDWFKYEFNVKTFTEVKESEDFKTYIEDKKKNKVYTQTVKRKNITYVARYNSKVNKVIWDSGITVNSERKVVVTKNTSEETINYLYSILSYVNYNKYENTIQLIKGSNEDYDWLLTDELLIEIHNKHLITEFLDINRKFIKVANVVLDNVDENLKNIANKISNRVGFIGKEDTFYNKIKESVLSLDNLAVLNEINKLEKIIEEYSYLKNLYNLYESYTNNTDIKEIHNIIQNLKNNKNA